MPMGSTRTVTASGVAAAMAAAPASGAVRLATAYRPEESASVSLTADHVTGMCSLVAASACRHLRVKRV